MKNIELQNKLKQYPDDMEVFIHDINRDEVEATGDPEDGSQGYYPDFGVEQLDGFDTNREAVKILSLVFDNPFVKQEIDAIEELQEIKSK